jgi:HAD superfamily hydrolase (TIGR01509 family)
MDIKAVLFDFAATLFDPARVVDGASLAERARQRGVVIDESTAHTLVRRILTYGDSIQGRKARIRCDLSPQEHHDGWVRLAGEVPGVSPGLAEAFHDCITDPLRWQPYPDTRPTLLALRDAGLRVAVVSNCGWDLRTAFQATGLHELVDDYVLSCEHGRQKPDPELFRYACARLGVAPGATVMVGDDPRTDTGALAAGVEVYLLPSPEPFPAPRGLGRIPRLCSQGDVGRSQKIDGGSLGRVKP